LALNTAKPKIIHKFSRISGRHAQQWVFAFPVNLAMTTHQSHPTAPVIWATGTSGQVHSALPEGYRPVRTAQDGAAQAQLPAVCDRQVWGWKIAVASANRQADTRMISPLGRAHMIFSET
jgi:hypothetical protein